MSDQPKLPDELPPGAIHMGNFTIKGPGTFIGGVVKLRNDPERDLLNAAEHFLKAADRCLNGNREIQGVPMLTEPGAMCAAFACELYLKYIHLRELGESPHGHDLAALFKSLPESSREDLVAHRGDIAEVFERNKGQFVDVRYHHEKEQISFRQHELLQLAESLSAYVEGHYKSAA